MKNHLFTIPALMCLGITVALAQVPVISPTLNNGGFESELLDGNLGMRTGSTSGNGTTDDRFAVSNGTITIDGWTLDSTGFGGLDGSQVNDFTDPPPANGQDSSPNRGLLDSRRVLLVNNAVEVEALSEDVGSGFRGDVFRLSLWTGANKTSDNHFSVAPAILFDAGLASEELVPFTIVNHTENDAPEGTLADNVTTGFILRDESAFGSVLAPAAYTTAQLSILVDNNGSDGANEGDQVYLDDVTLTLTQPILDPNADEDSDNLTNEEEINGLLNPYDIEGNFVGVGNGGAPTDPLTADSDGDGIEDGDEVSPSLGGGYVTDPNRKDTDDDTIEDGDEVDAAIGSANLTDPTKEDTDDDDLPDWWENDNGLDPTSSIGVDGADGDREPDGLDNLFEFDEGTDPNNPDTDGDGVTDGVELNDDGTDPLDPDADHDRLNDGAEKAAGSDPFEQDTDRDEFSDSIEVNVFGTDPNDENDVPTPTILMDFSISNGSFEDTTGGTNPSNPASATTRFAAGQAGQVATLPGWSARSVDGFIGFDSSSVAYDGSFYGFVNDDSVGEFQSAPIAHGVTPGEVFHLQLNTTNNQSNGSSQYTVSLIFDNGTPIEIGAFEHAEEELNEYYERYLSYQATTTASEVAVLIESDNSDGGDDQPRFDLVRLYAEPGVLAADLEITGISVSGGTVALTYSGEPSTTYTLKSSQDLTGFVTTVVPTGGSLTTDASGQGSVEFDFEPGSLFVRLEELSE
ncbi:hypothetical protein [Roseibacillus persicicus]|uniref:hypothetical protein n=1 Tax=Roseibacillus persicicus TaxID=454148 RepID=UPI00280D3E4B|nr:hypothetical protein [Roseibacillus persicicus]MDQ8191972.1 hypothetical protein [Roseibacillus persicicus]